MRGILLLSLALAACDKGPPVMNQGASEAQIRRLATLNVVPPDLTLPAHVQPLLPADLVRNGIGQPTCDFTRDGQMLLAINATEAVARVAGIVRHFVHASPMGPTGGFFSDRQVSISVGRTGQIVPGESGVGRWPARMTVTNRHENAQLEQSGVWRCG